MCTIRRLSWQLVDCRRRVVGRCFHSQLIGRRWGSACERLGAQVNGWTYYRGVIWRINVNFYCVVVSAFVIATPSRGFHLAAAADCQLVQPTTPETIYCPAQAGRHLWSEKLIYLKRLEWGSNPRPQGWQTSDTTTRPTVLHVLLTIPCL
jgi:hypothetical protein